MFEVGDKVELLKGFNEIMGYKVSKEYEVLARSRNCYIIEDENSKPINWSVQGAHHTFKKVENAMFKVGDKVEMLKDCYEGYGEYGKYPVKRIEEKFYFIEDNDGYDIKWRKDIAHCAFNLVIDDSIYPYHSGEEIVFTDVSMISGTNDGDLTVGKVYEVIAWQENKGLVVEHLIIKDNRNKELIIRYDEFKYVKKVSELERKIYVRIGGHCKYFEQNMVYEAVEVGELIIFCFNDKQKRQQIYDKTNVHIYFEEVIESVDVSTNKDWSTQYDVLTKGLYNELVNELDRKDKEIAELKHTIKMLQPLPMIDVNQERAIVIHRAKQFFSEHINKDLLDYDVIYTESRRKVTVLLKKPGSEIIHSKGFSICSKGDVFNFYIGRAIALGRALGIDVSYFENAVQPELAIGQIVKYKNDYAKNWKTAKVVSREEYQKEGKKLGEGEEFLYYLFGYDMNTSHTKVGIINDTKAQY